MRRLFASVTLLALLSWPCAGQDSLDAKNREAGQVIPHSQGLHGYIGFSHDQPPVGSGYSVGMGFYAAVWPLVNEPLADFQIGLPSSWVTPDNSDNQDRPLAPEGTLARTWKERGPTWSSVFQTLEGGLGYWAGNHFRYGPPKFSLNATPQCYATNDLSPKSLFPQYYQHVGEERVAVPASSVPMETKLLDQEFKRATPGVPYTSPTTGAWTRPGA